MGVYLYPSGTETELKNAYIGYVWTPGSNTIAYYPFKGNTTDVTGNTTLSGTMVQDGLGYRATADSSFSAPSGIYANLWVNIKAYSGQTYMGINYNALGSGYYIKHGQSNLDKKFYTFTNSSYSIGGTANYAPETGTWHNISIGYDGTKTIYSVDGVVNTLYNGRGYNSGGSFQINYGDYIVADVIVENRCWTSTEISNYYNQTKANYGIS